MSLDHADNIVKHQTAPRDAFLGGQLSLAQPARGFRAGLDSVLLGASVSRSSGALLDLGAGVGTAALVALTWQRGLAGTLVEIEPEALALAALNAAGNGLADRTRIIQLDVIAPGAARAAAGLASDHFAAVIANPPFFAAGQGTRAPEPGRAAARQMDAAALDLWVKTAAAGAAPGGEIIFIYPAPALGPLLASFEARFGGIAVLPLSPRTGDAATRVLIRGIKGSRAPLRLLTTRFLHETDNAFTPEIEAVLRGETRLLW